nr:hypothetical protein [Pseudolysinimonas kribbensis]
MPSTQIDGHGLAAPDRRDQVEEDWVAQTCPGSTRRSLALVMPGSSPADASMV